MTKLTIHRHFETVLPLVEHMFNAHYEESARNKVLFKLAPTLETYRKVSESGGFMAVVAHKDGGTVGYSVNFISNHPHYTDAGVCWNDLLYLMPEYRETNVGGRLMVATRQQAKALGCRAVSWHAKPYTALDSLLRARNPVHEVIYMDML